jgi:hypothetical protein
VLNVDLQVPCPLAETVREPYPRSLVTQPTTFALLKNDWSPSEDGLYSAPQDVISLIGKIDGDGNPLEAGLVRRVQFGMRAQRLPKDEVWLSERVPDINWVFTGPSSDGSPRAQGGVTATYAYAAASYAGPEVATGAIAGKGRRFDLNTKLPSNRYDLPAYPVKLTTYCGFWQTVRGDVSVKEWKATSACFAAQRDAVTNEIIVPAGHATEGCPTGQISAGSYVFRWKTATIQPWMRLNMKDFGLPNTFVVWTKASGGGLFKTRYYKEPANYGIFVPVVEVQTVQQDN